MANPKRASTRSPSQRFCGVADAADLFGVSEMTLYRAIHAGQFPAIRIMGRFIVPLKAIEAMEDAAVERHVLVDAAEWIDPFPIESAEG